MTDEGLTLWSAVTQFDISHISEFNLDEGKLFCKIHFNKQRVAKWEPVQYWVEKIPSYFKIFIENPSLIPNELILQALKNLC